MTTELQKISANFDGSGLFLPLSTASQAEGELGAFGYELRQIGQYSLHALQNHAMLLTEKLWKNGASEEADKFAANYLISYPISLSA